MTTRPAISIRPATPDEAPLLNELTGRSALNWGYETAFLDWEPEAITVTAELIARSQDSVFEEDGRFVGYYSLTGMPPKLMLDKLFVEPDRIGHGCGKRLWWHAVETERAVGASVLTLARDPNAARSYEGTGVQWTHEEQTTRPGWAVQTLRFKIHTQGLA